MEPHVADHEPPLALFVPDDDPLLFYRAIASYAARALRPAGMLYFEINPLFAADMQALLSADSFQDIELMDDLYGKQRFIKCHKAQP
jgi:release factor glutamine methyltransferase